VGARVAICTTWGREPHPRYWKSLLGLRVPGGWVYQDIQGKQGVDEGHNWLIRWFLEESGCEWMLHVDSDAVLHPGTLERLLSWDEPLVSALAFRRKGPRCPVVYIGQVEGDEEEVFWKDLGGTRAWLETHLELLVLNGPAMVEERPDDALIAVDRTGAHCLLTHRRVFEAMEPPWFRRVGSGAKVGSGSDFWFHREAQAAGFTSWVDRSVIAGHLNGDWCVGGLDFLAWDSITDWGEKRFVVGRERGLQDNNENADYRTTTD